MARRSVYYFDRWEDYDEAGTHIADKLPGNYNNGVYFEKYGDYYKAEIYDSCTDPEYAASIIREHGGKYYCS